MSDRTADDILVERLHTWITESPDYYDVAEVYDRLADLKKQARLLRRDINATETEIDIEVDKPRSTEVKKRKLDATAALVETLAVIEADIEWYEMKAKKYEYMRGMFQSAGYVLKSRAELVK